MPIVVTVDGVAYQPMTPVKRCESCVKDVQRCGIIIDCVTRGHKWWIIRPSLKNKEV